MQDTCTRCIYYGDELNPCWCRRHGIETEPSHSCDSWEEKRK